MTLDELDLNSTTYDEDLEQALCELPRTKEGMEALWSFIRYDNEVTTEGWIILLDDFGEMMDDTFRKQVLKHLHKVFTSEHIQAVFSYYIDE